MNTRILTEAITNIRDEYVLEYDPMDADLMTHSPKRPVWKNGWLQIAACFIAVLAIATVLPHMLKKNDNISLVFENIPPSGSDACLNEITLADNLELINIKESAIVYSASAEIINSNDVDQLKKLMGLDEYPIVDEKQTYSISDGMGKSIVIFKSSGSLVCSYSERDNLSIDEMKAAYKDEEFIDIAREWLESSGLLSEEFLEKDTLISDNGFIVKTVDGKENTFPTLKTIVYKYHNLDGVEVGGVAPRIVVDIALNGKIVSVSKIQRHFEPYSEYALISIDEAVNKLEQNKGVFYLSGETSDIGTVESVELAYYNREVMDDCPYLIPVYVFRGTSGKGQFTGVVIALKDSDYNIK